MKAKPSRAPRASAPTTRKNTETPVNVVLRNSELLIPQLVTIVIEAARGKEHRGEEKACGGANCKEDVCTQHRIPLRRSGRTVIDFWTQIKPNSSTRE